MGSSVSQVIIRVHLIKGTLPPCYENITDHVPNLWVCELYNFSSEDDEKVNDWVIQRIEELELLKAKNVDGLEFNISIYYELDKKSCRVPIDFSFETLSAMFRIGAKLEIYVS